MQRTSGDVPALPVRIACRDDRFIEGALAVPRGATGIVIFAQEDGGHSPRNPVVATRLRRHFGLATLLVDLLASDDEHLDELDQHIARLASRVADTVCWTEDNPHLAPMAKGLFGSAYSSAAALVAVTEASSVRAVVCRGGRPDLAGNALPLVCAPTLLLVGERDDEQLAHSREALDAMRCERSLQIIPGAGRRFEEPGKLADVARAAGTWFHWSMLDADEQPWTQETGVAAHGVAMGE